MLAVGVVLIVLIFKIVGRAGRGLWHRGDRRDGDLHRAGGGGGALSLEMEHARRAGRVRRCWG